MIETLNEWDKALIIWFHQSSFVAWKTFWLIGSGKTIWFLLGGWFIVRIYNFSKEWKKILKFILLFGVCILITDRISSGLLKPCIARLRPCHQTELLPYLKLLAGNCGGKYGFVSSHAANIFGWITLFLALIPTTRHEKYFLIAIAFWISISRLALGVHFLTDILCGAGLGFFIAKILSFAFNKFTHINLNTS